MTDVEEFTEQIATLIRSSPELKNRDIIDSFARVMAAMVIGHGAPEYQQLKLYLALKLDEAHEHLTQKVKVKQNG